jgi:hypothetical protein
MLLSHYLGRVRRTLMIIPLSDLPVTSPPTSFNYSQSISGCGLQLSWWGPPAQDHFSTINPVLGLSSLPTYPFLASFISNSRVSKKFKVIVIQQSVQKPKVENDLLQTDLWVWLLADSVESNKLHQEQQWFQKHYKWKRNNTKWIEAFISPNFYRKQKKSTENYWPTKIINHFID